VQVLEQAKLTRNDIAEVVLLGGCSRVHAVRRRGLARFPHAVLCGDLHADEAVAVGATVQVSLRGSLLGCSS
jgi:molecular chaperone DnaK (HSP70)